MTNDTATRPGRALTITAGDGFSLAATLFEPDDKPRGTVLVHGATAVPARFYAAFATHLARRGLRVLTYDYRGIGASKPKSLRGFRADMTTWATVDARAVHRYARGAFDEPLLLVGHSFGGQLLGLLDEAREAKGAVLFASQLGTVGHWPLVEQARLRAVFALWFPLLAAGVGYVPGRVGLGEDLPGGVAREWSRWCRHPEYLVGYHPDARERFARFDVPTLLLSFTDDDYAPRPAVEALRKRLPPHTVRHRRVAPRALGVSSIGHFSAFRPRFEGTLWAEATSFLEHALADRADLALRPRFEGPLAPSAEELRDELAYGR